MSERLRGRVGLVIGGTSGIGRAVAAQLAAYGAHVVVAGRNQVRGERAAKALVEEGYDVRFRRADVRCEADVESLIDAACQDHGAIDYLFNSAGIEGVKGPIHTTTEQVAEELVGVNVKGMFLSLKHALPRMAGSRGGVIVNTASFLGTIVPSGEAVLYGATKAAVLSMTRSAGAAFAHRNVKVYAVCPWITDTPMADRLSGHEAEAKAVLGRMNPSGQIATPDDIAGVVVALFTGRVGLATGEAVLVDSGRTMQKVQPTWIVDHAWSNVQDGVA